MTDVLNPCWKYRFILLIVAFVTICVFLMKKLAISGDMSAYARGDQQMTYNRSNKNNTGDKLSKTRDGKITSYYTTTHNINVDEKLSTKYAQIKSYYSLSKPKSICTNVPFRNIYGYESSKWEINKSVCLGCFRFVKSGLKTPLGIVPIYVYERKDDLWVSGAIIQNGGFEYSKLNMLLTLLKKDLSLNFIDIGANLGIFSLNVAKLGRKVLAVEALYSNVQHLCFSIKDGGFENNITVVHNAVSDEVNKLVKLGIHMNNMGGTFIDDDSNDMRTRKKSFNVQLGGNYGKVKTITLDSLLDFEKMKLFKNVVIKMDIEGFEYKVLSGAKRFFETINIRAIFMEWVFHRTSESGNGIIDFMTTRNFTPYTEDGKYLLKIAERGQWPLDILWLPHI